MIKKIILAVIIAVTLWGLISYVMPTFFIRSRLLSKIQNKENLSVVPIEKFQVNKIDYMFSYNSKDYSLNSLSFKIPQEYNLYKTAEDTLVFKADGEKAIMVFKSDITDLNNQFKEIAGRAPWIEIHDMYKFMKKAMYAHPDKVFMTKIDGIYLLFKALLLGSKEKVNKIYNYETDNLKGFMIVSQGNGNHIKRFEMFSENNDWIGILFLNTTLSQKDLDSILSTLVIK